MTLRRVDLKAILRDPEKRRILIAETVVAIQAREGRDISIERALELYDKFHKED